MKKLIISLTLCLAPCFVEAATWQTVVAKVQSGQAVKIGVLGNSIGCGQMANDSSGAVFNTSTMLNSSYALGITGLNGATMLSSFGPANVPVAGWGQQLYSYLLTKNASSVVINLSGSGWDTGDQLGVYSAASGKSPVVNNVVAFTNLSPKPDAVLLPLEVNDWGHYQTLSFFNTNFQTIITTLNNAGIVPIPVIESPINNRPNLSSMSTNYNVDIVNYPGDYYFTQAARTIAASNNLGVIDFETPMMALANAQTGNYFGDKMWATGLWYDGASPCGAGNNFACPVHPNQSGHNLMAGYAIAWFKQRLDGRIPLTHAQGIPATWSGGVPTVW